jgi:hypothetical protein
MSANNTLAILQTSDGFRVADIGVIWVGEEEGLHSRYNKAEFSQSPVFKTQDELDAHVEKVLDQYFQQQRVLEYGTSNYELEMSFTEYLSPLVQCPVCQFPTDALGEHDMCSSCFGGESFE